MINKSRLLGIIESVERGERQLRGDMQLLREAVDLLDELATTVDKIMHSDRSSVILGDYSPESTQELKITKVEHYRPEVLPE